MLYAMWCISVNVGEQGFIFVLKGKPGLDAVEDQADKGVKRKAEELDEDEEKDKMDEVK